MSMIDGRNNLDQAFAAVFQPYGLIRRTEPGMAPVRHSPQQILADPQMLTLVEIQAEIGKYHLGAGEVRHKNGEPRRQREAPGKEDVAARVGINTATYPRSDKPKDRGKRPTLWAEAREIFPVPAHVRPLMKGSLAWSERDGKALAVDLISNTWRNPANAQFKRQKLFYNILPRINGPQIYQRRVPIDDWDSTSHKTISKAIQRAISGNQGWLWFDNAVRRGYMVYLTSTPGLAGFEPIDDVKPVLIDALKSIYPPDHDEHEGRFRPYGGSDNWKAKADDTGEEDAGRWEIIAVAQGPTDFVGIEAECVVAGIETEYQLSFWRGQPYHGLAMRHASKEAFVAFVQSLPEQYTLTEAAMASEPQSVN